MKVDTSVKRSPSAVLSLVFWSFKIKVDLWKDKAFLEFYLFGRIFSPSKAVREKVVGFTLRVVFSVSGTGQKLRAISYSLMIPHLHQGSCFVIVNSVPCRAGPGRAGPGRAGLCGAGLCMIAQFSNHIDPYNNDVIRESVSLFSTNSPR